MKILVVEDQPWLLDMECWPEGATYTQVGNFREMRELEDIKSFDGILLDHRLPQVNGDDVATFLVGTLKYDPSRIVRISSMQEGGYPEGIGPWISKNTSNRMIQAVLVYLASDRGREATGVLKDAQYGF